MMPGGMAHVVFLDAQERVVEESQAVTAVARYIEGGVEFFDLVVEKEYNPDQPRDEAGRWGSGGTTDEPDSDGDGIDVRHPKIVIGAHHSSEAISGYLEKNKAKEFKAAKLPKKVTRGQLGHCYENATLAVIHNPELQYAEGVAFSAATGELGYLHAWAVDKDGSVVDPTWDEPEKGRYYGVVYDKAKYLSHARKTGYYGVLGNIFENANKVMKRGHL